MLARVASTGYVVGEGEPELAKPILDLQPMSTGDILDRTIRLYRRHFLHTLGIVSIPYLAIFLVGLPLGSMAGSDPKVLIRPDVIAILVAFGLVAIWLYFVSMGAMARSVSERYLGGTPTIWGAYAPVLRRGLPLIWAYFLAGLTWVGVAVVGSIVVGMTAGMAGPIIGAVGAIVIGAVGALVVGVVLVGIFFRLLLVTQVIVIEEARGASALKRSWVLMNTKGNPWRALLILLFSIVVGAVVYVILNFPGSILAGMIPGVVGTIVGQALGVLGQMLILPIGSIAFTLLYYDSRIRREAFDLEMMAQQIGVPQRAESVPTAPTGLRSVTRPVGSSTTQIIQPSPPRPAPTASVPVGPPAGQPSRPGPPSVASPKMSAGPTPAGPPRPAGNVKVCPKCRTQFPPIRPACPKCGTLVAYRPSG